MSSESPGTMPSAPAGGAPSVLANLNEDGSRRWLRPRVSKGRFLTSRRAVAYGLIALFSGLPHVTIAGRPAVLIDLAAREFTFFGMTFLPTDTLLLASLMLAIFLTIFLVTALLGRVWCGWGCPQTVYLEFLYRPIERLFDGRGYATDGRAEVHPLRTVAKYATHLAVSAFLAHTFLAYFVGVETLAVWMTRSPFEHPQAFLLILAVTALMMIDFAFAREQVCTLMCPYGRFQSALLDRQSLIIGYDVSRGEPRGRMKKGESHAALGDCIDCKLCVTTCPTGIDIRNGLQMECVGCAQCIDACDAVMEKIGRSKGLVRYSSQQAMAGERTRLLRPRVVVYPLMIAAALGLFGVTLAGKSDADVIVLRNRNVTYTLTPAGDIANVVTVKVTNRTEEDRTYEMSIVEDANAYSADLPLTVSPRESKSATIHLKLPRTAFEDGRAPVKIVVTSDAGGRVETHHHVLGPLYAGGAAGGEAEVP